MFARISATLAVFSLMFAAFLGAAAADLGAMFADV